MIIKKAYLSTAYLHTKDYYDQWSEAITGVQKYRDRTKKLIIYVVIQNLLGNLIAKQVMDKTFGHICY